MPKTNCIGSIHDRATNRHSVDAVSHTAHDKVFTTPFRGRILAARADIASTARLRNDGLCAWPVTATQPPSDTSIHELIEATGFDQIMDRVVRRLGAVADAKMDGLLAGKNLNPEQMRESAESRKQILAAFEDEISWQRMEPEVTAIYKKFYTQQEIDALTRFYLSPSGKRLIAQVPNALTVINQSNVDEWSKIRRTQGDAAFHERVAQDLNAAVAPQDIDGYVAFYDSEIGRAIRSAADQAGPEFRDSMKAREFAATQRIKPMLVELNARINAAK